MFFNRTKKAKEEEEAELKNYLLVSKKLQAKLSQGNSLTAIGNSQPPAHTLLETPYLDLVRETLRERANDPMNQDLKNLEKYFKERDHFDVFIKKVSDKIKSLLERFVNTCIKIKKKDYSRSQDLILKEIMETYLSNRLLTECLDHYNKQLKGQVEVTCKAFGNEYLDSLIHTLEILLEYDASRVENLETMRALLKGILFTCLDHSNFKEHVINTHTNFSLKYLGFSSERFDNGYKLFEPLFLKGVSAEEAGERTNIDRFRSYISSYCRAADKLEPRELKKSLSDFFNLFFMDNFTIVYVQSYPDELHRILEKVVRLEDDEDYLVRLLKKVLAISSTKFLMRRGGEEDVNPFVLTVSVLFIFILQKYDYGNSDLWGDLYDSLLNVMMIALNAFDDMSFFRSLRAVNAIIFKASSVKITTIFGDFIQKFCLKVSRMKEENKGNYFDEISRVSHEIVLGIEPKLFDLDPNGTSENITDFLYQMGSKLDIDQKDSLARIFLPIFNKGLLQVEALVDKNISKLFERVGDLISKESTFKQFKDSIIDKLFQIKDLEELKYILNYCALFINILKDNKLVKMFLSNLIMSMNTKETQMAAWPLIYELIKFVLDNLENKEPAELKSIGIYNMTIRILQLYRIFVKKREESGELTNALRFSSPIVSIRKFSDLSLFCDIVKKIQGIFKKDIGLIEGFSEIRGYEKVCQDASYYIETFDDSIVMIRFLTDIAYADDRSHPSLSLNKTGVALKINRPETAMSGSLSARSKMMSHNMSVAIDSNVVPKTDLSGSNKIYFRNTLKQDKFDKLTISSSNIGSQTFVMAEPQSQPLSHPEAPDAPTLRVPELIYNIILYLLDRAPLHFREWYISDLLTQAEHNQELYMKLRNAKVFYALVYSALDKDGYHEDEKSWKLLLSLFKRRPNIETYRLLFDKFFEAIEKQSNPNFEEILELISFDPDSMTRFSEYFELSNNKAGYNNFICVPSTNLYDAKYEKYMDASISPMTFSMWVSKDKIKYSSSKFTIFSIVLVHSGTIQWRLEVFWEATEIKMKYDKYDNGVKKEIFEYLYVDNPVKPLLVEHSPLNFVFTLNYLSDKKSMQSFFFINGRKVNQKELTGLSKLGIKVVRDKNEKKSSFKAYCGFGYLSTELNTKDKPIEHAKIREVFLCRKALEEREVQTLHTIYFPQLKTPIAWFNDLHPLNLRHLNEDLKDVFSQMEKCPFQKPEEYNKFPDVHKRLYLKLDTTSLFCRMEFVISGVPAFADELPEEAKMKQKLYLLADYRVTCVLGTKDSKAYMITFGAQAREINKILLKDVFWSVPPFECIVKSQCILEKLVTILESCSEQTFKALLKNGIIELFRQSYPQIGGQRPVMSFLYILLKRDISLSEENIKQIVYLFGVPIERSIAPDACSGNEEDSLALVDPHGICLLFDIFFEKNWSKRLPLLLKYVRSLYLRESAASR